MPDALTAVQFEVMRRVRDGTLWSAAGSVAGEIDEVVFLCGLGLLRSDGTPGIFELTDLGGAYLEAVERSGAPE